MQRGNVLIFLLAGILIIAAVGGAFYLGRSTTPKPSPVPIVTPQTPQPTLAPSTSASSDETINWKTYTNTKWNISFKYPINWDYSTTDDPNYIVFKPSDFAIPSQTGSQIPEVTVSLMRENYDSAIQRLITAYGATNKETITFDKLNWVHIWGTIAEGPAQGLSGGGYVLNNNGKALEFDYEVVKSRSYNQEAKQMISTLKLTQ